MATPLPHLGDRLFFSDGGLETSLIFLEGVDLPLFAAFVLLADEDGRQQLRRYWEPYLALCAEVPGAGFVLDTPTWRANPDWGKRLGLDATRLRALNTQAAHFMRELRADWAPRLAGPVVVSGTIGPRGDGYLADEQGDTETAAAYHWPQAKALAAGGVDMLSAVTMTNATEAAGVALAGRRAGVPVAVSFTVETDGRLPSGEPLGEAIERVDSVAPPAYFGLNCAHPLHLQRALDGAASWVERIRCVRANASTKSHAELDAATELDSGDPQDLALRYRGLKAALPRLNVLGGCCGTDTRHLRAIRDAWLATREH